jgi:monovalent cation:proton antiporter-2 (CPA2) family protein
MDLLTQTLVYLIAAIIAVLISRRLGFGSVLGYLAAGIAIGPYGLALVHDPEHIMHFAELGVVLLLFIVGLELKPSRLWVMRRMVFGLGTAQVLCSAAAIWLLARLLGFSAQAAAVVGFTLALSSTAFVLQMLAEKKQLTSAHGRAAFSMLLFQDLAAIPLIAVLPLLGDTGAHNAGFDLSRALVMAGTIAGLIIGGRLFLRPVLRAVAAAGIPEIFTATALLVVIGAAMLMKLGGMSMVLGAFLAGMLLADSEYRHQLEADIAPFKGLLLGLFFIAVGMTVHIELLLSAPGRVVLIVVMLMSTKTLVLVPLARAFGACSWSSAFKSAALMAQGGEFGFVLFSIAARGNILEARVIDELILAVTVSMMLTPLLFFVVEYLADRSGKDEPEYDTPEEEDHGVIIAGFGRVGQIIGRVLRIIDQPFTAVERDSSQVDIVRRYGNQVYYGDVGRAELLRAAGAQNAKVYVVAIGDVETSLRAVETAKQNFPHLTIIARARNRLHAHKLMELGVQHIVRETLLSSLAMTEDVLMQLGLERSAADRIITAFRERDERLLHDQREIHDSEEHLIQSVKEVTTELEALMKNDLPK